MSAPKLHLTVPPGLLDKLKGMAAETGLPVNDFVVAVVAQHVIGGAAQAQRRGPASRPPAPAIDLPSGVERAATASGFTGVHPNGRMWAAKAGRELLGKFSTPELAATIRHYTILGFRVGRGAFFGDQGVDLATALEYALRAGYGAMPTTPMPLAPAAQVGPDRADPAHPAAAAESTVESSGSATGPGKTVAEPRETSADGGRTPSTSPPSIAQLDVMGQLLGQHSTTTLPAARRTPLPTGRCPVCAGPLTNVMRKYVDLCLLCNDDFETWQRQPAAAPPDVPAVYDSTALTRGSPAVESFADYVKRVREL